MCNISQEPKAKLPDVLVEYNSIMRGAIPCLPVPLAWFCLIWNVLLPGTGTNLNPNATFSWKKYSFKKLISNFANFQLQVIFSLILNFFYITNSFFSLRNCLERFIRFMYRTAAILSRCRIKVTTRCTYCQSCCGCWSIIYCSILPRWMGLEYLVGRHHGPFS